MLCLTYFTLGEGGVRGATCKVRSTCSVGVMKLYYSLYATGVRISSSSNRPVGLLYIKAQGGCCTYACVQWCEVRRRVVKRAYSVLGSG